MPRTASPSIRPALLMITGKATHPRKIQSLRPPPVPPPQRDHCHLPIHPHPHPLFSLLHVVFHLGGVVLRVVLCGVGGREVGEVGEVEEACLLHPEEGELGRRQLGEEVRNHGETWLY